MITTIPDRERALQAQVDALKAEIARLRAVEPVAWKHDCAGLCTNDVELWIDACPHCGKPRAAPPAQPAEPVQRLSDEQIDAVTRDKFGKRLLGAEIAMHREYGRAIESALQTKATK